MSAICLKINQDKPIRKIKLDLSINSIIEYLIQNIQSNEGVGFYRVIQDITNFDTNEVISIPKVQINTALTQPNKMQFLGDNGFEDFAGGNLNNFNRSHFLQFEGINITNSTDINLIILGINKDNVIL